MSARRPAIDVVREALTTLADGREGFVYELALELALLRVGEEARAIADAALDTLRGELHAANVTIEQSRRARERAQADARAAWERFNDAQQQRQLEIDAAVAVVEDRDATIRALIAAMERSLDEEGSVTATAPRTIGCRSCAADTSIFVRGKLQLIHASRCHWHQLRSAIHAATKVGA